jgi:hypothetical protein
VTDANDAMLAFAGFGGRPYVLLATPTPTPADLAAFRILIAVGTPPPSAEWTRTFRGRQLSVFERRAAP